MKHPIIGVATGCLAAMFLAGCGGTLATKYTPASTPSLNQPVKDPDCYDASVLLGVDVQKAHDIAIKVLTGLDSTIDSDTATDLHAQRNRHFGVVVGSGGEELTVHLEKVSDARTFLAVTTKTGFVGAVGQKAWSCQAVDEAVKLASP